ncbi:unnamed protein product [Peronospora effusa]|nr:unnamed protein product [Peronospora effusa]
MRTSDGATVQITWSKEVAKEPVKVICMYQVGNCGPAQMSLLGTIEFEPGFVVRKLATVKIETVVAILVKEDKTLVRRNQFSQSNVSAAPLHVDVRTFPRACSLRSIRASDRRVAFLFGVGEGSLGSIAFCRFNESFTSVEATQTIDIGVSFGLAGPLVDILLTERSLCVVDENGDIQSFDVRTRRTSKKASCGNNNVDGDGNWVGGLLSFADELVVGRAKLVGNKQLRVCSISNEDHRALPSAVLGVDMPSTELAVGSMGDVLYVANASDGTICSSQLSVTVRSDAYRIQRSGNGAKSSQGCLQANQKGTATQHWLRLFYHVFEKFPVRSLIDMSMSPDKLFSLTLEIAADGHSEENHVATSDAKAVCVEYLNRAMVDLRRLNKPLCGLDLVKNLKNRCSELTENHTSLQFTSMQRFVLALGSFVPVQICRAEDNMLRLLQNGQNIANSAKSFSPTNSGDEGDASGTDAAKIAQTIRFGLLSPLLESWNGRCVVVTSMGKQSTGKSYFLNHLTGTSFAISGSRCTDGAWMSLRFVSAELLLVILDFEGLGSFERSEQEDVFFRFDKDIDGLFSRFQKGVQLIKNDPRLFRGLLYMSVKDVNMNDRQGVVDELVAKLDAIFEANKDQNFLTEMYAGQLEINCTPPFGTMDYYQCMENEAAQALCSIVFPSEGVRTGFVTGKAFLDCVRIVLAKISILDWTGMVKSTQNLVVADTKQKLPGILRTGCHVSLPLPLVADKIIPSHLKEDVLQVGSYEKFVVTLQVMCETCPGYKTKWMALNDVVPLDSIRDEKFDMGFDVTSLTSKNLEIVQKAIGLHFQFFLDLRGKAYGTSKLSTEDQSDFDAFEAFVLHRRKKKVSLWLFGLLGDHLSAVRSQLEQRYAEPLILYMSRCQQRCIWCQLGCMYSVTHSPETEHNCCMDHKCRGQCEYGECQTDFEPARVPACSRSAGHEGKCECEKGEHTCGQPCILIRASNCDKTCAKRAEHSGDHSCSVQVHICGVTCSATTCTATCLLDVQRDHSVHKCAEVQCFHPCMMEGCNNMCSEKNHFHGQQVESRAFAKENGTAGVGDLSDNAVVTHMCSCSHACGEICTVEGICEQKVHLKKSARTYTGARGSFDYIYQEMNGCKKRCAHVKSSGEVNHEGLGHTCLVETNEEKNEQHTVHYCDARCPSCNYYCNKHTATWNCTPLPTVICGRHTSLQKGMTLMWKIESTKLASVALPRCAISFAQKLDAVMPIISPVRASMTRNVFTHQAPAKIIAVTVSMSCFHRQAG